MRERMGTIGCWLLLAGCGGQGDVEDPDAEGLEARLDDACFTAGRVIGLEHRGDECVLSLGLDTTGVWQQTLEGCEDGTTAWQDLLVEAEVPAGASLEAAYRLTEDMLVPVGLPWTPLDGDTVDLSSQSGRFLEVRVEVHASTDHDSPELRGVSAGRRCSAAR